MTTTRSGMNAMVNTAIKEPQDATDQQQRTPAQPQRAGKLPALLLTSDDNLWPKIGAGLRDDLQLKQIDSIEELQSSVPAGQAAIVLWDARGEAAPADALSRLQLHSARFATVALVDPDAGVTWTPLVSSKQLVAFLPSPFDSARLREAIDAAVAETQVRVSILGGAAAVAAVSTPTKSKTPVVAAAAAAIVLAAAGAAYWKLHGGPDVQAPAAGKQPAAAADGPTSGKGSDAKDEKVFPLLQAAQEAMRERHYIEPAAGSAIALYHEALLYDPNNDEARQGMQRLAEILFSRVQSALDERKFDIALQSLETARSIDPSDRRIAAIDARIASMRTEIGSAQIAAALNAQAFDRADQLLDDAARSKSLPEAKIVQLREETSRRRADAQVDGLLKLLDARLQQDRLTDPHNDNATYYLDEARRAGASAAALQPRTQELARRLHAHDSAAANGGSKPKADEPNFLELAQARLGQGQVLEPERDSALYYLNQLSAAEPKNPSLPLLASAVQAKIVVRAAAAVAAGQTDEATRLLQTAAGLGASPEITALNDKLAALQRPVDAGSAGLPFVNGRLLQALTQPNPEYPQRAESAGTEGWVELSFTVTAAGKVTNVSVLDSTPPNIFDQAAIDAMTRMRYRPYVQDGHPIAITSKLRLAFHLTKH